jgi:hypothetical protein
MMVSSYDRSVDTNVGIAHINEWFFSKLSLAVGIDIPALAFKKSPLSQSEQFCISVSKEMMRYFLEHEVIEFKAEERNHAMRLSVHTSKNMALIDNMVTYFKYIVALEARGSTGKLPSPLFRRGENYRFVVMVGLHVLDRLCFKFDDKSAPEQNKLFESMKADAGVALYASSGDDSTQDFVGMPRSKWAWSKPLDTYYQKGKELFWHLRKVECLPYADSPVLLSPRTASTSPLESVKTSGSFFPLESGRTSVSFGSSSELSVRSARAVSQVAASGIAAPFLSQAVSEPKLPVASRFSI